MCKKRSTVICTVSDGPFLKQFRVDPCIRDFITSLNLHGYKTVGCCCGHGIYPLTVVCKIGKSDRFYDLISGIDIPRKRNFYKKDSDGYYYITEVMEQSDETEA